MKVLEKGYMLAADELLKALSEEGDTDIPKDYGEEHDFGKVLDLCEHADTSYGEIMCADGVKRNILYRD